MLASPPSAQPHVIHRDDAAGTEEWMAFFEDPDGNTLALMSRVPDRARLRLRRCREAPMP